MSGLERAIAIGFVLLVLFTLVAVLMAGEEQ